MADDATASVIDADLGVRDDVPGTTGFAQWYLVGVLSLAGVLAFADRIALSLIITPLKDDLHITDLQASLLLGFAFSVLFSLASIPAGHLADTHSRRRIVMGAVAVWSVAAAVCGMAQSYTQLFLARMGLGIGEGGSGPASVSMIRDAFPREKRGKAFALYHATPLIGGGGALFFGGFLLAVGERGGFAGIPLFETLRPWQVVLVTHALLGLPIMLLLWLAREPSRRREEAADSPTFGEALRFVGQHKGLFVPLWIGVALLMAAQGGVSGWLPTVVHRAYDIPIARVGRLLGPIQMLVVPIGGFLIGALIDKVAGRRLSGEGPVLVTIGCVLITAVAVLAQLFVTDLRAAAVLYAIQVILYGSVPLSISLVISQIAPGRLVGKLSAVSGIFSMLLGFSWGPTATSLIADAFFTGPRALLEGLIMLWAICLPLGALCYSLLAVRLRTGRQTIY